MSLCSVSLLNANVIVVRNNYGFYVSLFAKLVFQSVVLTCITTKVGDEAKQQYHDLLHNIMPDHWEKFLLCDKFAQRLDVLCRI